MTALRLDAHSSPTSDAIERGPWGEAVQYWLQIKGWSQARLIREIRQAPTLALKIARKKMRGNKNTISRAFLGRDCNTTTLRLIATALNVPLEAVLVSPARKSAAEERKQMILEITEKVARELDPYSRAQPLPIAVDDSIAVGIALAEAAEAEAAAVKKLPRRPTLRSTGSPRSKRRVRK